MSIFFVAEIGINHNGNMDICKELIDVAKDAGCDAVKFQKRDINKVYTQEFLDSPRESPWGNTQRAQKEGLELSKQQYQEIASYCAKKDIEWFASAWDINSQRFLGHFDCKFNNTRYTGVYVQYNLGGLGYVLSRRAMQVVTEFWDREQDSGLEEEIYEDLVVAKVGGRSGPS